MEYVNDPPHCTCAALTTAAAPEDALDGDLDGDLEGDLEGDADVEAAFKGAFEGALDGAWDGSLEGALVGEDVAAWAPLLAAVQLTDSTADPVLDPQAPISRVTQPETVAEHCDFLRSAVQSPESSLVHGP